jgi:phosphoribosylformylglycinamidine cyclo-ligase
VRILPEGCEAVVDPRSWPLPPLFRLLQDAGGISTDEMRDVFNLGIGMIAVAPPNVVDAVCAAAAHEAIETWVIGDVRAGAKGVRFSH